MIPLDGGNAGRMPHAVPENASAPCNICERGCAYAVTVRERAVLAAALEDERTAHHRTREAWMDRERQLEQQLARLNERLAFLIEGVTREAS